MASQGRAIVPLLRTYAVRVATAGLLLGVAAPTSLPRLVDPERNNIKYDGRFTFARLVYTTGPGGYYYRGLPAWAHGYNVAEENLMKIMREVTALRPHVAESNALALDDPELMKYPVAYMTEAGFWTMTDREAAALRKYLLKGGFIIFDDFRDDFRSAGWANFSMQMARLLPGAHGVDLAPTQPIVHSFFAIATFDDLPQYYDRRRPLLRVSFDDSHLTRRVRV